DFNISRTKSEVFEDVWKGTWIDEVRFAVAVIVFVDRHSSRLAGIFGRKICRTIFVFNFDKTNCRLRGVFGIGSNSCHRLANKTNLSLGKERHVLDRFAVRPWSILPRDYGMDTWITPGFVRIDSFDDGMRLRTKQYLAIEHIGQDEVISIDRLPG